MLHAILLSILLSCGASGLSLYKRSRRYKTLSLCDVLVGLHIVTLLPSSVDSVVYRTPRWMPCSRCSWHGVFNDCRGLDSRVPPGVLWRRSADRIFLFLERRIFEYHWSSASVVVEVCPYQVPVLMTLYRFFDVHKSFSSLLYNLQRRWQCRGVLLSVH